VYFAPWMVASIAVTVAYPLLFVRGRAKWLPLLAAGALGLHVLVEWGGRGLAGLGGVAGGLAVTTALILGVVLAALGALAPTLRALVPAALVCGLLAAVAFGLPAVVAGPFLAAVIGLIVYALVLGVGRPPGLRHAWAYLHSLQ
jgi:hypothetical protein